METTLLERAASLLDRNLKAGVHEWELLLVFEGVVGIANARIRISQRESLESMLWRAHVGVSASRLIFKEGREVALTHSHFHAILEALCELHVQFAVYSPPYAKELEDALILGLTHALPAVDAIAALGEETP